MMEKTFKATPHIWISKHQDYKGDDWYWYAYELHDWTNTPHKYEGMADSKQELAEKIGDEIAQHILEDGMLYGL